MKLAAWFSLVGAALTSLRATSACAQVPKGWSWIQVAPDGLDGWTVRQGSATVELRKGRLRASLNGSGAVADFWLDGQVDGGRVAVTERQPNSDAASRRFVGTIRRERTSGRDPANGWGSDRIVLRSNDIYLGLVRPIHRP